MTEPAISVQPVSVNGARRSTKTAMPPTTLHNTRMIFLTAFVPRFYHVYPSRKSYSDSRGDRSSRDCFRAVATILTL
jgi:hypothetical protein